MAITPKKIEFDLGRSQHGNPLTITLESNGHWTITRHAINQRDQTDAVRGITSEQLELMAKAETIHLALRKP